MANIVGDRLSRLERVLRCRNRMKLVEIALEREVRSVAAGIRERADGAGQEFMFDIEVPLLHVRPDRLRRNRVNAQRKIEALPAGVGVSDDVVLIRRDHQRRGTFQRFRIAFVAIRVLVEDSVGGSDRSLTIAGWVPGKAEARRWVEQMALLAARFYSSYSALHESVERVTRTGHQCTFLAGNAAVRINDWDLGRAEGALLPIERL